jgi:hypothetical protein
MSASTGDSSSEENSTLLEDNWVRDVTKMGVMWLIGTIIAILLLLFVGPKIL